MLNKVFTIRPYKLGPVWVFDEPSLGLKQEVFVPSASAVITAMVKEKKLRGAEKGFTMIFSDSPFPDYDFQIKKVEGEASSGTWYVWNGIEAWICAVLSMYYEKAPENIYCQLLR